MAETLYLIDGHSMIYRAYYAPFRPLTSPTGEPTRATYVFTRQMLSFIQKNKPRLLAMAVDGPIAKLRRRAAYAEYKITRKPMPSDLPPQVDRILQIVEAMGIRILKAEGYEADDILATAVEKLAGPDLRVVLISRDKDLDQLIGPHAVLYDPMKDETLDTAGLLAQKGYPPEKAVEVQTLCGDDTDNIPGIPGVGPKTAAKLIAQYGTADAVAAHAAELTPKLGQSIKDNVANLSLARKLVTLERDVPIDLAPESLRFEGVRAEAVGPIFRELGFAALLVEVGAASPKQVTPPRTSAASDAHSPFPGSLFAPPASPSFRSPTPPRAAAPLAVSRSDATPAAGAAPTTSPAPSSSPAPTTSKDFDYRCIDTPAGLDDLVQSLQGVRRLAIDTETTSTQPMTAKLVGISLSWSSGKAVYIPVKGPLGATVLSVDLVREKLSPILADLQVEKVGHNLKYDMVVLRCAGFPWAGKLTDTMIAAYVLDATRPSYKLDVLAAEMLNHHGTPIAHLIGTGRNRTTMDTVPIDKVTAYASEDADLSLRLADILVRKLQDERLIDLLVNLEMPLLAVLEEMEQEGVLVDAATLRSLETEFSKQADAVKTRIAGLCGAQVNPDSPRQLAEVLFNKFKLPVVKKTSTGLPSTDESVLEQLAAVHELPAMVLEYRKLVKLISTYLLALRDCIHPRTGRVHTCFHQTGTETGRLSSSDPNLQNIPIRTEQGRRIRSAFVAGPGNKLISADYSQVELRVLAHLCGDAAMIEAFRSDQDVHRFVASEVFGVKLADVTPEQRSRAKTVNFGIIYGQTAFGLARTLGISRSDAGEFITAYHKRFPLIAQFLQKCIAQAKDLGYVETIFRRRRKIVGIDSANPNERSAAERLAINSVVQGSAADLIKQAMVNIARRIRSEKRPSRMLLQIHDELLFETPEADVPGECEMISAEMSGAMTLTVPLKVDVGVGANWMEAK